MYPGLAEKDLLKITGTLKGLLKGECNAASHDRKQQRIPPSLGH